MAPQDRLSQISSQLNYPRGLLADQVAIITGSGQGIGAEAARLFANEGAKVIVTDIDARQYYSSFPIYHLAHHLSSLSDTVNDTIEGKPSLTRDWNNPVPRAL